jgi:hypothetical protein
MAERVETEPTFQVQARRLLFKETGIYASSPGRTYDVAPDGERFLVVKRGAGAQSAEVILVQNWFDELQRLVPTN